MIVKQTRIEMLEEGFAAIDNQIDALIQRHDEQWKEELRVLIVRAKKKLRIK